MRPGWQFALLLFCASFACCSAISAAGAEDGIDYPIVNPVVNSNGWEQLCKGIVGVATAIGQSEHERNSHCASGGTSIFTALNQEATVRFVRGYDSPILLN